MSSSNPWLVEQLLRILKSDSDRAQEIELALFKNSPHLYNELVIGAVDQEMLSVHEATQKTTLSIDEVMQMLQSFRTKSLVHTELADVDTSRGGARLVSSGICVWEVIREYRKSGEMAELGSVFPDLTKTEIVSAITYAEAHPLEIEREITAYEAAVQRRKTEYPCS